MVNTFKIMADDVLVAESVRVETGSAEPSLWSLNFTDVTRAVSMLSGSDMWALVQLLLTTASARVDLNALDERDRAILMAFHDAERSRRGVSKDLVGNVTLIDRSP